MATTLTPRMKPKTERTVGRKRKELADDLPEYHRQFAEQLRKFLDARGMSNKDLTDALRERGLDLTEAAVNLWIRGSNFPDLANLPTIADVLMPGEDYRLLLPAQKTRRRRR